MKTEMRAPWQVLVGIVILSASLLPVWLIDLSNAPGETQLRLWTTLVMAAALLGVARRMTVFRWILLVLLGTGVVVSVWSFVAASTVEVQSTLITLAQVVGVGLLFTPGANVWFRKSGADAQGSAL